MEIYFLLHPFHSLLLLHTSSFQGFDFIPMNTGSNDPHYDLTHWESLHELSINHKCIFSSVARKFNPFAQLKDPGKEIF